jgi:putative ABC transport system permease protein
MSEWKQEIQRQLAATNLEANREAEIVEELAQHMEFLYEELLADGATPAEAQQQTFAELHENQLLTRELRRVERQMKQEPIIFGTNWRKNMIADFWQDLRYAARMLRKNPGFTLIAVVTLALGIGANTAIFSVVDSVLLRPLPYKDPDRLVMIRETKLPQFAEFAVAPGNFLDWQKQTTAFEHLVGTRRVSFNLTGNDNPEQLRGMNISTDFCAMLGISPQIGREFLPEEGQPGHNNVVILSHGLWQRRFGGDPNIINQTIRLDNQSYTIVGVMPATFYFLERNYELWTPLAFTPQQAQNRGGHNIPRVIGQLKPGVTVDQARTELSTLAEQLAIEYPINAGWNIKLLPLLESTVTRIKPALLVLLGAVAFVLLIACANVANLLLARATGRQKEIAIRTALGAGRWRIVRQLLTESVLLSLGGGILGLLLAKWSLDILMKMAPQNLPRLSDVALDGRVLVFSAAITLLTGIVFGLVPALQASKPNINEAMKDGGRGSTEGGRRQLIRNTLVVLEVAAALVVLVGAGLITKTFIRLQHVDTGFNPDQALAVTVSLPPAKYPEAQRIAFFQQLIEKVKPLPGVQSVGVTTLLPLSDKDPTGSFVIQGRPALPPGTIQPTTYSAVNADYFTAMGIPLLRGRFFTEHDRVNASAVIIVNETMVRKMFPDEDPIGKYITFGNPDKNPTWMEIVGVVGDVKHYALDRETTMQTYWPYTQDTNASMTLVVRTTGDPTSLTPAIRSEVLSLDKEQPISAADTLDQLVSTSIAQQQFSMLLFAIFAVVAMALASIGIYGVLSYSVIQRTHEIGIRLALGAQVSDVLRMVIKQGLWLAITGIACGVAVALTLAKLTTSFSDLLYGVKATDPMTFAVIAIALLCVALVACYIPARRATKVDPMIALRGE